MFDEWDNTGLHYKKALDAVGTATFTIDGNDSRVPLFVKDAILEVMREDLDNGLTQYPDAYYFVRDPNPNVDGNSNATFAVACVDFKHLLKRREIGYPSGDPFASQSGPSDDVMKLWVDQNAGLSATSPPRVRTGTFPNFDIDTFYSKGPVWNGARQWQNLFDVVHEIALASATDPQTGPFVDFDVVMTHAPSIDGRALQFLFKTYYPMLGLDRSQGNANGVPPAVFSPQLGNITNASHTLITSGEITVAIVLGAGQQADREFVITTNDARIADSPWNDIEKSGNVPQDGVVADLGSYGKYMLNYNAQRHTFQFDTMFNSGLVYGRDWNLGDIVSLQFNPYPVHSLRVTSVTVDVKGGQGAIVQPDFSPLQ